MTQPTSPSPAPADISATELAPAKINLFLHVCGRRADGYHLLDSLVVFTAVGDQVTAVRASETSLAIAGPFAPGLSVGADNLVIRAANYFLQQRNQRDGARLTLEKNLPVAAGIGGGSSDAAATLRACAAMTKTTVDDLSATSELAADTRRRRAGVPRPQTDAHGRHRRGFSKARSAHAAGMVWCWSTHVSH